MLTTIYFTESKDFKLIKHRVLSEKNDYLVYIYADTSNIKIPKELIKELPIYGNNLIWIDTAKLDSSQIINHMTLMIGQFLIAEDDFSFYIASKTQKYDKLINLLVNEGVEIMTIGVEERPKERKKSNRRGRPPKQKTGPAADTKPKKRGRPPKKKVEIASMDAAPKRRGRPPKKKSDVATPDATPKRRGRPRNNDVQAVDVKPKRRGRPPKIKPVVAAKDDKAITKEKPQAKKKVGRPSKKTTKVRKPRVEKVITKEMVEAKMATFASKNSNVQLVQEDLFKMGKVKRPKFDAKMTDYIMKRLQLTTESEAGAILNEMKLLGMMDNSGKGGRLTYKD